MTTGSSETPGASGIQSAVDSISKHWLVILATGAVAVATITWGLSQNLQVAPRDLKIGMLQKQVDDLKTEIGMGSSALSPDPEALHEVQLSKGSSVTTRDGLCEVLVDEVWEGLGSATITVTIGSDESKTFNEVMPGHPVSFQGYIIHLLRLNGSSVTMSISKIPVAERESTAPKK